MCAVAANPVKKSIAHSQKYMAGIQQFNLATCHCITVGTGGDKRYHCRAYKAQNVPKNISFGIRDVTLTLLRSPFLKII